MRFSILFSLLILAVTLPNDTRAETKENTWRVMKNSPPLSYSAEFSYHKGEVLDGKVIRTGLLTPRYYYDLFDSQGNFQARGITRFLSLGTLFSWGIQIDLYDAESFIGMIDGKVFTKARAKFVFYNNIGDSIGVAYLNNENADFIIVSPKDEATILADLKGKAFGDLSSWEMKSFHQPSLFDERLLKVFAAFVADYHARFLPPPKLIHYYNPRDKSWGR